MRIDGKADFTAPPQEVWELFHDPEVLAAATPGCERLEPAGDGIYDATLTIGVAGINGKFQGRLTISDARPPESYRLTVEGRGGPGFVNAGVDLRFEGMNGFTTVHYAWDVQVGGAMARIGQRVLGGVGRSLIDGFFKSMQDQLSDRQGGG